MHLARMNSSVGALASYSLILFLYFRPPWPGLLHDDRGSRRDLLWTQRSWSPCLRVSGRSPELDATGAKRPSVQTPDMRRRHISGILPRVVWFSSLYVVDGKRAALLRISAGLRDLLLSHRDSRRI